MDAAVGVVDVKSYYIETAEDVAQRVRLVMPNTPLRTWLVFAPDCGLSLDGTLGGAAEASQIWQPG